MKGKFEVQVEANKRVFTQNFTVFFKKKSLV